jgi:hypothetical protein
MPTDAELKAIKEQAEPALFAQGVSGVGLGPRFDPATGTLGSEIVIALFSPQQIPGLPSVIQGVSTQWIPMSNMRRPFPADDPLLCGADRRDDTKYKAGLHRRRKGTGGPLEGGAQIGATFKLSPSRGVHVVERQLSSDGTGGCLAQTSTGRVVLLTNYHVVSHQLHDDESEPKPTGMHVGQPSDRLGSSCCPTSNDTIGYIWHRGRADECDGALIALVPGTTWVAEVQDGSRVWPPGAPATSLVSRDPSVPAGVIRGDRDVTTDDLKAGDFFVQKRGIRTGVTYGRVRYVYTTLPEVFDVFPNLEDPSKDDEFFARRPRNQIVIEPTGIFKVFNCGGDSGSVVLDDHCRVVGLVWGVTDSGSFGFADAIAGVKRELGQVEPVQIATAGAKGDVRTAPPNNLDKIIIEPGTDHGLQGASGELPDLQERLLQTEAGASCFALFRKNEREVLRLVTRNRRVAAVWQLNNGPTILNEVLLAARQRDHRLPREIGGVPLERRLLAISGTFARFGSAQLREDLAPLLPRLSAVAGGTLDEVLAQLAGADRAA